MLEAGSYDLSNGAVVLRLLCALFFIPHMYFKVIGNPPPAIKTFVDAGYWRPLLFVRLALVVELLAASALLLDVYTHYAALLCAALLLVAAITIYFANGKKFIWLWVKGGNEYPVFWAIACVALSILYWP